MSSSPISDASLRAPSPCQDLSSDPATFISSPSHPSSQSKTGKPKKQPTVTPRRFRRFFTPRITLRKDNRPRVSRLVLGNLSEAAANGRRRIGPPTQMRRAKISEDNLSRSKGSKRKGMYSPLTTPEQHTPVKRRRETSSETESATQHAREGQHSDVSDNDYEEVRRTVLNLPKPVVRSRYRGALGILSRRELNLPADPSRRLAHDYAAGGD